MKTQRTAVLTRTIPWIAIFFAFAAQLAAAADSANLPYMNPQLSPVQRATDLVHRMTLAEKATQMQNNSAAVPRLKVPAYQWWSEALHGVINEGVTEYPEPIGLAATFDAPGIHTMAAQIGIEGRIKHVQNVREGHTGIMGGLDFWSPNLNIFRDPRWGRGQETYGEDPFLTGRMGVAYVTGLQGDDPKYYLAIATPKHYAVHSGPEPTRHFADVDVSKHDEVDTYEPAFRAAVVEGKAGSVMCAYNAINGEPACANQYLLQDQLRGKWGFQGYVVSDCDAVRDVAANHRYRATQAQGAAISVIRGMDNECVTFTSRFGEPVEKAYIDAVQQGYLPESVLDTSLIRLFTARIKLGMFDPPDMVPYTKIDEKELDSAEHRAHGSQTRERVHGPAQERRNASAQAGDQEDRGRRPARRPDQAADRKLCRPAHAHRLRPRGSACRVPKRGHHVCPGNSVSAHGWNTRCPTALLTTPDGKPGLKAEYNEGMRMGRRLAGATQRRSPAELKPISNSTDSNLPKEIAGKKVHRRAMDGLPHADRELATILLGVRGRGFARLTVDGKQVAMAFGGQRGAGAGVGRVHLEKGQKVALSINYGSMNGKPHAELIWAKVNNAPSPEAVAAAKNADVVIAVVGITSQLEGEEMPVTEPGFLGGDRTSIDLPAAGRRTG